MQGYKKKRIVWIDAAKGVAIILMIVGHLLPFKSTFYRIIYSFHMPLFFILSGYTHKKIATKSELAAKSRRSLKQLIIPYLVLEIPIILYEFFVVKRGSIHDILLSSANRLFWASAVPVYGHFEVGVRWFLISMFMARTIIGILDLIYSKDDKQIISYAIGVIGLWLALSEKYLPLGIDTALVAVGFIGIGITAKKYHHQLRKYVSLLYPISLCVWVYAIQCGDYLDVGGRQYCNGIISVVVAIFACYAFCTIIYALCRLRLFNEISSRCGQESLAILCAHQLGFMLPFSYNTGIMLTSIALRVVVELCLAFVIVGSYRFIKGIAANKHPVS